MVDKGEINNSHITNIIKSEIGDALTKLPSNAQEKVIHNIIKNTNEKNLINREEIASDLGKIQLYQLLSSQLKISIDISAE